jgi:hypothetical protein
LEAENGGSNDVAPQAMASRYRRAGSQVTQEEVVELELKVRLCWLQERQEFIRLKTMRMAGEMDLGHQLNCMCQGFSVWMQLERSLSGLLVQMDRNLGPTIGDPSADTHG